jgi:hypothetical protein
LKIIYHFFADGTKLTYAAIGVGLLVAFFYFRIFFRDVSGFEEDSKNDANIPILDKDYDYVNSQWSHNKITAWILLSIGSGVLAYYQLPQLFPSFFR